MKKKNIVILGSTGSIGQNTLQIIERFPEQFNVKAISAGKNIEVLIQQIKKFRPEYVAVQNEQAYHKLKSKLKNCEILSGENGIIQLCNLKDTDLLVNAIIGSAGLKYTIEAIKNRKKIALANKESYVMAGDIINKLIKSIMLILYLLIVNIVHFFIYY